MDKLSFQRLYIRWWRQLFHIKTMFIYPQIERLGGRILKYQRYCDAFVKGRKRVEIARLRTKACVAPAPLPYSHFAFHLGKSVTKGKQVPLLVAINLGAIGPYRTAVDA